MHHILPTVRIVSPASPDGFIVINESDLTPEHKRWEEPKAEQPKAEAEADGRAKKR